MCRHLDCDREPAVRVAGGAKPGEPAIGWSGDYCTTHALSCVDTMLWQVQRGMPIGIWPLS